VEENHDLPLARVTVTTGSGAADDPPGREGLAAFAAELCRRGAAGRTRTELDQALEGFGAELDVSVDCDTVTFDIEVLSRKGKSTVARPRAENSRPSSAAPPATSRKARLTASSSAAPIPSNVSLSTNQGRAAPLRQIRRSRKGCTYSSSTSPSVASRRSCSAI